MPRSSGVSVRQMRSCFRRKFTNRRFTRFHDEISPDSCRLWDIQSNEKLDKDRFRRDMGGLVEAYQEVARRLGIMNENEPPRAKSGPVLVASNSDNDSIH